MHEHPGIGRLEPQRPEALVGDGQGQHEGERADQPVRVAQPRGHPARHLDLVVKPQREQQLQHREDKRGGREPHLQLDRAREEQRVRLLVRGIVPRCRRRQRDGDGATGQQHEHEAPRRSAPSCPSAPRPICHPPSVAHRTVTLMLLAPPGPPVTEVVPVRIHGHDSSWPRGLIVCVLVVVVGGRSPRSVFLRRAERPPDRPGNRRGDPVGQLARSGAGRGGGRAARRVGAGRLANIGPRSRRARRFGRFGAGSAICFPVAALYGEEYIEVGGRAASSGPTRRSRRV